MARTIAANARFVLVAGLVVGLLFPQWAQALKPWLGVFVAALLFLAALRIGPDALRGGAGQWLRTGLHAVGWQALLPSALALLMLMANLDVTLAIAVILMAAGAPISGSANLTIVVGQDPAPALRQLALGTLLLPLTVLPVFFLVPGMVAEAGLAGPVGRLAALIALAAAAAFALRGPVLKRIGTDGIDAVSAVTMGVMVIGLMSAVGPALRNEPVLLATTLALAFAANYALQLLGLVVHRNAALGICAGNRNMAIFLTALPASSTDPLLLFIGCYQVPMYLTPLLLGRLYRTIPPGKASS